MYRLLRVRMAPQPHEMMMAIAAAATGAVGIIIPEKISLPIADLFPSPYARVFYGVMGLFGIITVVSIFVRKLEGRLIERIGLVALACFFLAYSFMVIKTRGLGGTVGTILPLAWVVGNIWRARQIGTDLKLMTSYLRDHPGEDVYESREVRMW